MISVVIPAYNEENAIADTVRSALNVLRNAGYNDCEVLVVDDGSVDKTAINAEAEGAKVFRHPHNVGYGHALKTGIRVARHDTIVITDADGTYPIDAIPGLIQTFQSGFDMVVGTRQGTHYDESIHKRILRLILKFLVEYTAGRKIQDINSGLRVFSKTIALTYFPKLCDTFSFSTSLTLAYMMTGRFVCYHPIQYEKRIGTTKVRLLRDSLRTMQFIIEAITFYNPLKIFILLSTLLLAASFIGFFISAVTGMMIAYITGVTSLFLAILMFGIGLLAVLLKHILEKRNE
jgi:glycosyltransferase involved in cell wall biosynthesis